MATSNTVLHRLLPQRMIQNYHLVWLDENINENNEDCCSSIAKLRQVINTVNTFLDADECIDFITDSPEETAFMVVSESLGRRIIPVANDISQIGSIYIFCQNNTELTQWTNKCPKINGVFSDIESICKVLQKASKYCDQNAVSINVVKIATDPSNTGKDTLDCSFMYTQILKDILLTIDFDDGHINDFVSYCRTIVAGNDKQMQKLENFRKEYRAEQSILWYFTENFIYSMLNKALRLMDVDIILKMGFFLRNLHNQITTLHAKQFGHLADTSPFIVYRGQGLSEADFNQLNKNQGGLLSFNSFLSTSFDRGVSKAYAASNETDPHLFGVLFQISVNPSISISCFANIKGISHFQDEEEILFSMHTVFRIGEIRKLSETVQIWQVELTLTSDSDPELHALSQNILKETSEGAKGSLRLGQLLIKLAQFGKAEELLQLLVEKTNDSNDKQHIHQMLGMVNNGKGKYAEALEFYQKSLQISKTTLPANHPSFVDSYNNIGLLYKNMGEYSKALEFHEKSLEISKKNSSCKSSRFGYFLQQHWIGV